MSRRASSILLVLVLVLAGCKDRYRYDCQDPANWEAEDCKKPKCIGMGHCTEWLLDRHEIENETD